MGYTTLRPAFSKNTKGVPGIGGGGKYQESPGLMPGS